MVDIGGADVIREMLTRFYSHMFKDSLLNTFIFEKDGPEHHGKRFADWVIEAMGGEGRPMTESGREHMILPMHHKAAYSVKRDPQVRGRRFNTVDSRIWQRLHFLAVRECGLARHTAFWKWYVEYITLYMPIYSQ